VNVNGTVLGRGKIPCLKRAGQETAAFELGRKGRVQISRLVGKVLAPAKRPLDLTRNRKGSLCELLVVGEKGRLKSPARKGSLEECLGVNATKGGIRRHCERGSES